MCTAVFGFVQVISSLGDYLTANGGRVNLKQVDVIMSEVGEIEDEVFKRRKQAEIKDQVGVETTLLLVEVLLFGGVYIAADNFLRSDRTYKCILVALWMFGW